MNAELAAAARPAQGTGAAPWWRVALPLALAIGLARLLTLALAAAGGDLGLHVDEAQYADWARALDWGYYSKPPLIAALIAAALRLAEAALALSGGGALEAAPLARFWAVKGVALLLYPLTALLVARLAAALCADPDRRAAAAGWAAAIFLASPAAALLGLATTTDAPLLLLWTAASALLWQAGRPRASSPRVVAVMALGLGVVIALGLLAKYSFAAWLPGALLWWLAAAPASEGRPWTRRLALPLAASAVAALLLLPHLRWNAAWDWPTLRHTAQITQVDPSGGGVGAALLRLLGVPAGVLLLVGPLWGLWGLRAGRERTVPRPRPGGHRPAARFLLMLHAPLLLVGLLQSLRGTPQVNWLAPLLVGASLALALALSRTPVSADRRAGPFGGHRLAIGVLVAHLAIGALLPLLLPIRQALAAALAPATPLPALPRTLDLWARMRGWPAAWAALRPALDHALAGQPGPAGAPTEILAGRRELIVQGAWAWPDAPLHWRAWPPAGAPQQHYELRSPWRPQASPADRPLLLVGEADAPADWPAAVRERLHGLERLASADVPVAGHGRRRLTLWRAWPAPAPHAPTDAAARSAALPP